MQKSRFKVIQPAWDLFCKGDLAGAEQSASQAAGMIQDASAAPIPDIMLLKAFYLCRLDRQEDARKMFGRVLELRPDDQYAQEGYLLSQKDELEKYKQAANKQNSHLPSEKSSMLLIGIGSGRSGSTTLARLWADQKSCYCSHEHPPRITWNGCLSRLAFHKRRFKQLLDAHNHVGDVSHWWLGCIENLIDTFPRLRIVVLKRSRKATIDSFLRIKGGPGKGAINHWIGHDGSYWNKNAWDECYPDYRTDDMCKAIGLYLDEYYETAAALEIRYPDLIRIFKTETLSNRDTQAEILAFCEFKAPVFPEKMHYNKGGAMDGERMY